MKALITIAAAEKLTMQGVEGIKLPKFDWDHTAIKEAVQVQEDFNKLYKNWAENDMRLQKIESAPAWAHYYTEFAILYPKLSAVVR